MDWFRIYNTFESHGKSFFQGVKFSVQTISLGSVAYRKYDEFRCFSAITPVGRKLNSGLKLLVGSIKFKEAQRRPDKAPVRPIQLESTLK